MPGSDPSAISLRGGTANPRRLQQFPDRLGVQHPDDNTAFTGMSIGHRRPHTAHPGETWRRASKARMGRTPWVALVDLTAPRREFFGPKPCHSQDRRTSPAPRAPSVRAMPTPEETST